MSRGEVRREGVRRAGDQAKQVSIDRDGEAQCDEGRPFQSNEIQSNRGCPFEFLPATKQYMPEVVSCQNT